MDPNQSANVYPIINHNPHPDLPSSAPISPPAPHPLPHTRHAPSHRRIASAGSSMDQSTASSSNASVTAYPVVSATEVIHPLKVTRPGTPTRRTAAIAQQHPMFYDTPTKGSVVITPFQLAAAACAAVQRVIYAPRRAPNPFRTKFSPVAFLLFLAFLGAMGYYFYVRIAFTLNMGYQTW